MSKFLLFAGILLAGTITAQNQNAVYPENAQSLPILEIQTFNHTALYVEDTEREKLGQRSNHGRVAHHSVNMLEAGIWTMEIKYVNCASNHRMPKPFALIFKPCGCQKERA